MEVDHQRNGSERLGVRTVPGRACGPCTLCCKLLVVEAVGKPVNKWCRYCAIGRGCGVYETRPEECRDFYCGFMTLPHLGEEWRPSNSKLIVGVETGGNSIFVHVDPTRPDTWKSEPYYSRFKAWAANAVPSHGHVIVRIGRQRIVILPNRDVDLGSIGDDEIIGVGEQKLPTGIALTPFIMKRDDPRALEVKVGGPPIPL